ncbi:hypothetical protein FRB93_002331 [Tulasnella sp. JGI-2019a]|nr:hypothetical protein FRB93_002331 [Tulasnella sp. JGI-2019a]
MSDSDTPPSILLLASASHFLALFLIPWCINAIFGCLLFASEAVIACRSGENTGAFQQSRIIVLVTAGCGLFYGFSGIFGLISLNHTSLRTSTDSWGIIKEAAQAVARSGLFLVTLCWCLHLSKSTKNGPVLAGRFAPAVLPLVSSSLIAAAFIMDVFAAAHHQAESLSCSLITLGVTLLLSLSTLGAGIHFSRNTRPNDASPSSRRRSQTVSPKTSDFSLRSHLSSVLSTAPSTSAQLLVTTIPNNATSASGEGDSLSLPPYAWTWMVVAQTLGVVTASFRVAEASIPHGSTVSYSLQVIRTVFEVSWIIAVGEVTRSSLFLPSHTLANPARQADHRRRQQQHIVVNSPTRIPTLTTVAASNTNTKFHHSGTSSPFHSACHGKSNTIPPETLTVPMFSRTAATVSEEFLVTTSKDPFCPPPLGSIPVAVTRGGTPTSTSMLSLAAGGGGIGESGLKPSPPPMRKTKRKRVGKGSSEPLVITDDDVDDDGSRSKRNSPSRISSTRPKPKAAKLKERTSIASSTRTITAAARHSLTSMSRRRVLTKDIGGATSNWSALGDSTSSSDHLPVTPWRGQPGRDSIGVPIVPTTRSRPPRSHIPVRRSGVEDGKALTSAGVDPSGISMLASGADIFDTPTPSNKVLPTLLTPTSNRSSMSVSQSPQPLEARCDTDKHFLGVLIANALKKCGSGSGGGSGGASRKPSTTRRPSTSASHASQNTFGYAGPSALTVAPVGEFLDVTPFHMNLNLNPAVEDPSGSDTPTAPTPRASRALSPHLENLADAGGEVGSGGTDLEVLLNVRLAADSMLAERTTAAAQQFPDVNPPEDQMVTAAPALLLPAHIFTSDAIISESPASFTTSDEGGLPEALTNDNTCDMPSDVTYIMISPLTDIDTSGLNPLDHVIPGDHNININATAFNPSTPPRPLARFGTADTLTSDLIIAPFPPTPEQLRTARQTFQHPSSYHITPLPADVNQSQPIPIPSAATNREPAHVMAVGGFPVEDKMRGRMMRLKLSRTYSEDSSCIRRSSQSDYGSGHNAEAGIDPRRPPHGEHSGSAPIRRMSFNFFKTRRDEADEQIIAAAKERLSPLCSKFSDSSSMIGDGRPSLERRS